MYIQLCDLEFQNAQCHHETNRYLLIRQRYRFLNDVKVQSTKYKDQITSRDFK